MTGIHYEEAFSSKPVIDFDHHSPEYRARWQDVSDENLAKCPVAWSEAHGGFWLVSSYEALSEVIRDDATFSSAHNITAEGNHGGISLPAGPVVEVPIELDPPEYTAYHNLLKPVFSAEQVQKWRPFIQDITTACLDRQCTRGAIDFARDLASPVPAILTMKILGLPLKEWEHYAGPVLDINNAPGGSDRYLEAAEGIKMLARSLRRTAAKRRADPKDDLLTRLTTAEIDGKPLSDDRLMATCTLVLAAGVNTTTGAVANALNWLYLNPDHRQMLIDDPSLIPSAVEEFLRFLPPVAALARTATRDVELDGQQIRKGDRVLMSFAAANRDPAVFDCPEQVQFDRSPNPHAAFGFGIHYCVGAHLARIQIDVMLRAVLERMPDFAVMKVGSERYASMAMVNSWSSLSATFTPSDPVGSTFTF